jgi:hypothetical protein
MPLTWFEPIFPYSLIFDLSNYLLLSLIFLLLFKLNIIKRNLLYLSLIFLSTPFLFNGFLFEWTYLPDQSKYLGSAYTYRQNPEYFFDGSVNSYGKLKVSLPSFFYAFSPIVSLETYKGISLWNRTLFLLTWIYFIKKNFLDEYNSFIMLLSPSLIFSTSIALRENLIILLMFWFLYFYYNRNKLSVIIVIITLLLIKFQSVLTIFLFLILNFLIQENKIKIKLTIFSLISAIIIFIIFSEELLEIINYYRVGFFYEEFGGYISNSARMNYQFFEIKPNLASIKIIFDNFAFFSITPFLKGKINIFTFIIFLEILIIISYLFIRIKEEKKIYLNILLKWSIILFLSYLFYSIFIFNDGTIIRYKVPIFFFIIFGYFANIKNLKSK